MLRDLQTLVDAEPPGGVVRVPAGDWTGGYMPKGTTLHGAGRATRIHGTLHWAGRGEVFGCLLYGNPLLHYAPTYTDDRFVWWVAVRKAAK